MREGKNIVKVLKIIQFPKFTIIQRVYRYRNRNSLAFLLRLLYIYNIYTVNEQHHANTYPEIYTSNIVNNWERNFRIKQFAEEFKQKGIETCFGLIT